MLGGDPRHADERGDRPTPQQHHRLAQLHLLDVLGEVARRHALVDVFKSGEGAELLDSGFYVVAGDGFAFGDRRQIDVIQHRFVGLDGIGGDIHAEVSL